MYWVMFLISLMNMKLPAEDKLCDSGWLSLGSCLKNSDLNCCIQVIKHYNKNIFVSFCQIFSLAQVLMIGVAY